MQLLALFRVLLAVLLLASPALSQNDDFEDPIALTGHGSLFDAEGRQIEPTPEFLAETLAIYVQELLDRSDAEARAEFEAFRGRVDEALAPIPPDAAGRRRSELLAQVGLVEWLIERQPPEARIETHLPIIKYLIETIGVSGVEEGPLPPELLGILDDVLVAPDVLELSTTNQGQAYIDECAANGVPIPPDWGDPQWVGTGSLSDAQEFISQGAEARVFRYASTSPPGTCIALPRVNGDTIGLLGIICLGTQTSKACFWDNQGREQEDQGFDIDVGEEVPLLDFAGGGELKDGSGGVCTACHAGENPFIIHPGTALGLPALGAVDLFGDDWYDPLVHPDWPQNAGPMAVTNGCTGCHSQTGGAGRFPQMSQALTVFDPSGNYGYCLTVFPQAVARTMPPSAPGSSATAAHVVAMRSLCTQSPKPLLSIKEEVLSYGEVELGFAFAKALVLHNDGDANLTVTVSRTTPASDPDLAHFPEITEVPTVTLTPGDPPLVLRQTYEPQGLGTHDIELQVTSNDSTAPATTITLTGEGVRPRPIDSLLVLDRSGSMSELAGDRNKIEAMRDAVMLYTDLLRPDVGGAGVADRLGLVKYNEANGVYMPMTDISDAVQNDVRTNEFGNAALADPARLGPTGATGIGGAMLTGAAELGGPDPSRSKVMVVLTDGVENRSPWIADAINDIRANSAHIQSYSVGLGFSIEPAKLQSITNMGTEGYHQVVNTLSDETVFDLETFYFKIFSSAADMDLVTDPTHVIDLAAGKPIIVDRAQVVSSDRSATFLILDDPMLRGLYELEFVAPDGTVLQAGATVGGIPIHERIRNTYRILRIVFPDPAQDDTYVGDWMLRLVPTGRWTEVAGRNLAAESRFRYGGFMHPGGGKVPIGFAGAVASDYHLEAEIAPSSFVPGATLRLSAALTDRGWPAPDGSVAVTITRPDGTVHTVGLFDDGAHGDGAAGDAAWASTYAQTAVPGTYRILFRSVGRNERGELAPRLLQRFVTLEREPDFGDPGGPRRCPGCSGDASSYLIGSFDLGGTVRNVIHVMNPTGHNLDFVVALFDEAGQPFACDRGELAPNAIREVPIDRFGPPTQIGVVKVVAFRPGTRDPALGLVGNQSRVGDGQAVETGLHAMSEEVLRGDLSRILDACQ